MKLQQRAEQIHDELLKSKGPEPELGRIAGTLQVSKTTVKVIFKKHYGVSIATYHKQRRMAMAKYAVEQGWRIHMIAKLLHYATVTSLIVAYKAVYGHTPLTDRPNKRAKRVITFKEHIHE